jgi:hypothetical protein
MDRGCESICDADADVWATAAGWSSRGSGCLSLLNLWRPGAHRTANETTHRKHAVSQLEQW